jgi:O-6-methylguanine DNA methyltransferase
MISTSDSTDTIFSKLDSLHKQEPTLKVKLELIQNLPLTQFQKLVLNQVCQIPFGQTISYSKLADLVGKPKAVRATASAVALNQNFYIIPCHRVISKSGKTGQYRWGSELKQIILDWEQNYNKSSK